MSVIQFKDYMFRYNPRKLEISLLKETRQLVCPLSAFEVQDLGRCARMFKGEGELFGEDAVAQARTLMLVFDGEGPGRLFIPGQEPVTAYFAALKILHLGADGSIPYTFEFIEAPGAAGSANGGFYSGHPLPLSEGSI